MIVDVPAVGIDKPLHYIIPPPLANRLQVGHRVMVPLRNRRVEGFVIGFPPHSGRTGLREIHDLIDEEPVFGPTELELARWISQRYLSLTIDGIRCILPPHSRHGLKRRIQGTRRRVRPGYRLASVDVEPVRQFIEAHRRRAPAQVRILEAMISGGASPVWTRKDLLDAARASAGSLDALVRDGLIVPLAAAGDEAPGPSGLDSGEPPEGRHRPVLMEEQARALERIAEGLERIGEGRQRGGHPRPILLEGVTGSGKTEVYMRAVERVLEAGGQALVLVPEIALTPQAMARFRARFGQKVALLHSRLAPGERVEEWWRIRRGEAPLVVGTRSAVFAPLGNLRLIIVDEEHEPSYKQDEAPRYHAREVARKRAEQTGALLVLGSATPSAETYVMVETGAMERAFMGRRVHGRPLPAVELVDMRQELREGNRGILSRRLLDELGRVLADGHQAILFLNRRGYSSFVLCRDCGGTITCADCAVSLTYHASGDRLRCHYCDRSQRMPPHCPECRSRMLRRFGTGTQRVEEAVKAAFPDAITVRMDFDTTRRKGDIERILTAFRRRDAQVLIGTQMVAKGHDFPHVALVGAIAADSGLHLPDFRSAERTFQLLTQVAGRAGRADVEGRVVVQTYNPDHYSIRAAQSGDTALFFQHELRFRRSGRYPPYYHMARVLLSGEVEDAVRRAAMRARRQAHGTLASLEVDVLGPAPAPIPRLQGRYRWHMVIKGRELHHVQRAAAAIRQVLYDEPPVGMSLGVDVDPMSLL